MLIQPRHGKLSKAPPLCARIQRVVRVPRSAVEAEAVSALKLPSAVLGGFNHAALEFRTEFANPVGGIPTSVTQLVGGEALTSDVVLDAHLRPVVIDGHRLSVSDDVSVRPRIVYGYDGAGRAVLESRSEAREIDDVPSGAQAPHDLVGTTTRYYDPHGVLLGVCNESAGASATCRQPIRNAANAAAAGGLALTRIEPTLHDRRERTISPAGRASLTCRDDLGRVTHQYAGVTAGTGCDDGT
jgi:hypothetical protein